MPLDIIQGESRDRTTAQALAKNLKQYISEGTLYLGYPVIATADAKIDVDALLVSQQKGVIAFKLAQNIPSSEAEIQEEIEQQDRLFNALESHLGRHEMLRKGRQLAVIPQTATVYASPPPTELSEGESDGYFGDLENLNVWIDTLYPIDKGYEEAVQAALQRVATIKPKKKRSSVQDVSSKGAILKEIEKGIANLDRWQKAAAIESPEGPQRIRGLAGSGKTVVLALKAAYLHTQHPDWRIALTFHSRSLYEQMDDLVTRFTFEHSNDQPDEEHLKIIHTWGSSSRPGVYSMIARALGEVPRNWAYARATYGMDNAFQGICAELLSIAESKTINPIFDAVLIDEAQDLPPEFFRLVYLFTKHPKRIVWGYDELQKLSESAMPTTDELFGLGENNASLINLDNREGQPRRDIVLPICYRNTPWALSTAHALGLGVYRAEGLVQHPDEPKLWEEIGYNILQGSLKEGSYVALERSADSYPEYFSRLLDAQDAVKVESFTNEEAQDAWIAEQIHKNLTEDELEHDDILIVLPDSYRAKSRAPRLIRQLQSRGIKSHLVGVNSSTDRVFQSGSIALAHIYRAKGNEAPMVYAIDVQKAATEKNFLTARNTLFTAITRSRSWVRIVGFGDSMHTIEKEINQIVSNEYQLRFKIPTESELAALRHLNRERSTADEKAVRQYADTLHSMLSDLEKGEMSIDDLPPALRTRLANLQLESNDDNY
ncbi:DEAD/DEAH box helicase [Corynebacterium glutamicum]|uniref:Ycg4A n=2 Tax=Corynebacterium glutamicum TaxID=1718 RepID=Q9EUP1_CORGT|nr:ATP-binding domain-containing protein [Corynebacterium glutamicum]AAG00269.1 Ycg4A [Corynebacterium glutamicum]OKX94106.1 RNA helicase [Corynebacterium glutamicum]